LVSSGRIIKALKQVRVLEVFASLSPLMCIEHTFKLIYILGFVVPLSKGINLPWSARNFCWVLSNLS